jgi:DNA replication protein DnaC
MSVTRKKEIIKQEIVSKHGCTFACTRCAKIHSMIDKMEESNIPVGYWFLNMKSFSGSPILAKITNSYIEKLRHNYIEGKSICFAGTQGTGKTMSSICILKSALKQNFSAYYTTASDILNQMTDYKSSYGLRNILRNSDFLVIDELDSRFFTSDSTKELFSGIYENIFRFRSHNGLPTIICTNETDGILNVFFGPGVQSIESLNHQYLKIYPVVGKDFRKNQGNING